MDDLISRQDAIETLRANYPDSCYEQLREAVDVAIEALKAQENAQSEITECPMCPDCPDHCPLEVEHD